MVSSILKTWRGDYSFPVGGEGGMLPPLAALFTTRTEE
jgi:hypothetical protein